MPLGRRSRSPAPELRLLAERDPLFQLLTESVVDYAIFVLDPDGFVQTWNVGAERIKGYSASEIIGRHFSCFYPLEDVAAGKPQHELAVARQVGRFEDESWRIRKDGTRFWANVIISAMRDRSTGELRGFAKVTRDLTARVQAEETARRLAAERAVVEERTRAEARALQLLQAERDARMEAVRVGELQEQLMAIVGHDLRTPLSAILLAATLLARRGGLNGDQSISVSRIIGSAQRMSGIIRDLLDFSRARRGQGIPVTPEPVDLVELCRRAAAELEASSKGRTLRLDLPARAPVQADPERIVQVLSNLVGNALQHGTGSTVRVSVEDRGDAVDLSVHNDGPPIPSAVLPGLFEPFRRGHGAVKGGIGLGLYIVREIVRAHNGTVQVRSEEGEGTTFTVRLPRRADAAAA